MERTYYKGSKRRWRVHKTKYIAHKYEIPTYGMHRCQGVHTSTANVYSRLTLTKSNIAVANQWEIIKFALLFLSDFSVCLKILIKLGKK